MRRRCSENTSSKQMNRGETSASCSFFTVSYTRKKSRQPLNTLAFLQIHLFTFFFPLFLISILSSSLLTWSTFHLGTQNPDKSHGNDSLITPFSTLSHKGDKLESHFGDLQMIAPTQDGSWEASVLPINKASQAKL